jgi:hypothetical protein
LTAATAFFGVPAESGLILASPKPQCVSDSCTKWNSPAAAPANGDQP